MKWTIRIIGAALLLGTALGVTAFAMLLAADAEVIKTVLQAEIKKLSGQNIEFIGKSTFSASLSPTFRAAGLGIGGPAKMSFKEFEARLSLFPFLQNEIHITRFVATEGVVEFAGGVVIVDQLTLSAPRKNGVMEQSLAWGNPSKANNEYVISVKARDCDVGGAKRRSYRLPRPAGISFISRRHWILGCARTVGSDQTLVSRTPKNFSL